MGVCLKIVLVYSDRKGAELGKEVAQSLREKLGASFNMHESCWNTELLRSPKLRALSAAEAASSDLVLVSMEETEEVSEELRQWLALWQHRSRTGPAALVALLKRETDSSPRHLQEALHRFADQANMDFFCHSEVKQDYPRIRFTPAAALAH
jgi:hypothetical protein